MNKSSGKEKTVLCKFFKKRGSCRRGNNCTYAHGEKELKKKKKKILIKKIPPIIKEKKFCNHCEDITHNTLECPYMPFI